MGWAEAKKKREEEDRIRFEQMEALRAREAEKREAAAKLEREQAAEKRRKELARIQEYQDNVDFDRPGGVMRKAPTTLTKRDLENAQVMSSPVIDAEAKLQEATAKAGTLGSQAAAIALLRDVLAAADKARVPAQSPQRKAAAALLNAFEQAVAQAEAAAPVDPQQAQMNAIFQDDFFVADLVDDDLV